MMATFSRSSYPGRNPNRINPAIRRGVHDNVGNRVDTFKVIDSPADGYVGIYHTGDEINMATSSDLPAWTFRRTLDVLATQPSILALPSGGFLAAVEFNDQAGSGGRVWLRHYPTLAAALPDSGGAIRRVVRPRCHRGPHTPTVMRAH